MKRLLLALLLCGCSSSEYPQPTECKTQSPDINNGWKLFENNQIINLLPGAFAPNQVELIKVAGSHWTQATGGMINFSFITNYEYPFIYNGDLAGNNAGTEWSDKSHYPVIAIDTVGLSYTDVDGVIKLNNNVFTEAVMHELGHGLGLSHIINNQSLMNPSLPGIVCIDWYTIQALCELRFCSKGMRTSCNP